MVAGDVRLPGWPPRHPLRTGRGLLLWALAIGAGAAAIAFIRPLAKNPYLWVPGCAWLFDEEVGSALRDARAANLVSLSHCGLLTATWLAVMFGRDRRRWRLWVAASLPALAMTSLLLFPELTLRSPPGRVSAAAAAAVAAFLALGPVWRSSPTRELAVWLGAALLCALLATAVEIAWWWSETLTFPGPRDPLEVHRLLSIYSWAVTALSLGLASHIPVLLPYTMYVGRR